MKYVSVQDFVKIMNEVGARLTISSARKLLKNLPYRNGDGNSRLYKILDAESAYNKSFKTPKQHLGIQQKEPTI